VFDRADGPKRKFGEYDGGAWDAVRQVRSAEQHSEQIHVKDRTGHRATSSVSTSTAHAEQDTWPPGVRDSSGTRSGSRAR
jgi:hypothetical protein